MSRVTEEIVVVLIIGTRRCCRGWGGSSGRGCRRSARGGLAGIVGTPSRGVVLLLMATVVTLLAVGLLLTIRLLLAVATLAAHAAHTIRGDEVAGLFGTNALDPGLDLGALFRRADARGDTVTKAWGGLGGNIDSASTLLLHGLDGRTLLADAQPDVLVGDVDLDGGSSWHTTTHASTSTAHSSAALSGLLLLEDLLNQLLGKIGSALIGVGDGDGANGRVVGIGLLGDLNVRSGTVLDHFDLRTSPSNDETDVGVGNLQYDGKAVK